MLGLKLGLGNMKAGGGVPFTSDLVGYYTKRTGLTLSDSKGNDASILPSCAHVGETPNTFYSFADVDITNGEVELHFKQPAINARAIIGSSTSNSYIRVASTSLITVRAGAASLAFDVALMDLSVKHTLRVVFRTDTNLFARVYLDGVESTSGEQDYGSALTFNFKYIGYGNGNFVSSSEAYYLKVDGDTSGTEVHFNGVGLYEYDISGNANPGTKSGGQVNYSADASTFYLDSGWSYYTKVGEIDEFVPSGGDVTILAGYTKVRDYAGSSEFINMGETSTICLIDFDPLAGTVAALDNFDKDNTTLHIVSGSMDYYDAANPYRWRIDEITNPYKYKSYFNWAYDRTLYSKVETVANGDTYAVTRLDQVLNYGAQKTLTQDESVRTYCGIDIFPGFFELIENVVTVKASGGDYTLIQDAIDGIVDAASDKVYRVDIYEDFAPTELADFAEVDGSFHRYIVLKDYVYLNGVGTQKKITCSIPETATDTQTTYYEPISAPFYCGMKNIEVSMRNGRYALHIDASTQASDEQRFDDCKFINYSTQEVIDYRIANSQAYSGVFDGQFALGMGSKSYQETVFNNCEIIALTPWFMHTDDDIASPSYKIDSVTFTSMPWVQTNVNPLGNTLTNIYFDCLTASSDTNVLMQLCTWNSTVEYHGRYYDTDEADIFPINDIKISTYYNAIASFDNLFTDGGSLRITSASGVGSVSITGGTAEALIMPTSVEIGNYSTGSLEVGEWSRNANTKLGVRLGDCSGVSKTLEMSIDGGGTTTVTFDENFTAQNNAYVIAFIDTALAAAATASVYQTAQDYVPTVV